MRHLASIAGYILAEDELELALVHDISRAGVLAFTGAIFEAGETVELVLHLPSGAEKVARGHVTRSERSGAKYAEVWRYRVALRFDEPIDFADEIREISERQIELGIVKR